MTTHACTTAMTFTIISNSYQLKELIPSMWSWLWHHRLQNITTTSAAPRLWWHLGICGVTAMPALRQWRLQLYLTVISWRNWYRVCGHGCDTIDSQISPQPRLRLDCGDIWESVVSQPWPKMRYQFLFYHGTTKLTLNKESLSSQTASQLPKFKEQSHCKHWVAWPDCFATLATIVMSQQALCH